MKRTFGGSALEHLKVWITIFACLSSVRAAKMHDRRTPKCSATTCSHEMILHVDSPLEESLVFPCGLLIAADNRFEYAFLQSIQGLF